MIVKAKTATKLLKTYLGPLVHLDAAVLFLRMLVELSLVERTKVELLFGLQSTVENMQISQEHQFEQRLSEASGNNLSATSEAKGNVIKWMEHQDMFRASFKKLQVITGRTLVSTHPGLISRQCRSFQLAETCKRLMHSGD